MPALGWGMFSLVMRALNLSRSSARSMLSGEVPKIFVFSPRRAISFSRGRARLMAVWPPNCTIRPWGSSFSMMFITSSRVTGSKNSLSEVS
ncbi:MAG: hypothetical protein A4E43_00227 [Methanosaeta sp. PtaB.Bin005]|nr:MAG: hypothetical protein A4E43_00227 [Methanosaeta sp. PtaB.Bin005]